MGASTSSGDEDAVVSDINVTPLVDVTLVLLIVFMITMPAIVKTAPIKVELPKSGSIAKSFDEPLMISVVRNPSGEIGVYLGEDPLTEESLRDVIQNLAVPAEEQKVSLSADQSISYGDVVAVMDMLTAQGLTKIALNTEHVDRE